jgi:GNAT superfamily N-acetyltransferase
MTSADIPRCIAITGECWDRFTAQLASPDFESMFSGAVWKPFFYVAEQDGRVVGVAGYGVSWLSYGIYNMFWHGVTPGARRHGIGASLVRRRLADLAPIADVVMIATKIPDYYIRFGFETVAQVQTTKNYGDHLMIRRASKGGAGAPIHNKGNQAMDGPRKEDLILVPREPTEEMITAGLGATAAWHSLPGSALTVNREKMRRRYKAMIEAVTNLKSKAHFW